MEMFEYIAVLTSIIIGLGIAQLLQGFTRLIQHPEQGKIYWVHLCWVTYMFLTTVLWWWWEFRLGEIEEWTFALYMFVLFYAVLIYLLCAFLFPTNFSDYDGPKGYFYSKRSWFFGILMLVNFVDICDTLLKGLEYFASLGSEYLIATILKIVLAGVAMFSKNERYHEVIAVAFLLYQLSWALRSLYTVG
jgi:hypothetical protein